MKDYKTEQREYLFNFLLSNPVKQFTVEEIFKSTEGISKSAIYRNINKLLCDGIIRRFQVEGSRKFFYQYIGDNDCSNHIHLKCEHCGNIFHIKNESLEKLTNFVSQNYNFLISNEKSILFGCCKLCSKNV